MNHDDLLEIVDLLYDRIDDLLPEEQAFINHMFRVLNFTQYQVDQILYLQGKYL